VFSGITSRPENPCGKSFLVQYHGESYSLRGEDVTVVEVTDEFANIDEL